MNNNERPTYRQSVMQLQKYLYVISQVDPEIPRVNPDGVYGDTTRDAVTIFQKQRGLNPTGKVDYETWVNLLDDFRIAEVQISNPQMISPFSEHIKDGIVAKGDHSDLVIILHIMINCINIEYNCVGPVIINGVYGEETENAIKEFQMCQGLQCTGTVDLKTWNHLAKAYNKYVRYT